MTTHFSRRDIVWALSVGGVISFVSCVPLEKPTPTVGTDPGGFGGSSLQPVIRREIGSLAREYPNELSKLKRAVASLRARQSSKNDWAAIAKFHEAFCSSDSPSFREQIHFGWWFLPWHRAYLLYTEKRLQTAAKDPTIALPYWDWTRFGECPRAYAGQQNPLSDSTRKRPFGDGDPAPWELVDPTAAIDSLNFAQFGGRNPDTLGGNGALENGPHGNMHMWAAEWQDGSPRGNIGRFDTAALDPLFYAHHGNLDRIWEHWIRVKGKQNPRDAAFLDRSFVFAAPGFPATSYRVGDILDTEAAGYTYDSLDVAIEPPDDPGGFGEKVADPLPSGGAPLLRGSSPLPPAGDPGGFGPDSGTRVYVVIEDIVLPSVPVTLRLFITDLASQRTAYASTISLLPLNLGDGGNQTSAKKQRLFVDITDGVAKLPPDAAMVQVVLEPIRQEGAPPLSYGALTIVREGAE